MSDNLKRRGKGRPKGSQNKFTLAQKAVSAQLLEAWHSQSKGRIDAVLASAIKAAEGETVTIKTKSGAEYERTFRDFAPLGAILPYIARKMPESVEFGILEHLDPAEIDKRWPKRQDKTA